MMCEKVMCRQKVILILITFLSAAAADWRLIYIVDFKFTITLNFVMILSYEANFMDDKMYRSRDTK